jgi:hypothetical protein
MAKRGLSSYIILLLFPSIVVVLSSFDIFDHCYLFLPSNDPLVINVVRAIYTGVCWFSLQIVVMIYSLDSFVYVIFLIWIFPFVFSVIYRWAVSKWTVSKVNKILFILIPVALLIGTWISRGSVPFLVLVALTMAAPFWSFLLSLRAAIWLFKNYETKLTPPRGLGLTAWIAAYIAALRFDFLKMYELYAALPPTPPPIVTSPLPAVDIRIVG